MSAKRLGIETLLVIILALCAAGVWWWKDREAEAEAQEWDRRVSAVREQAEGWAAELAKGEAEAAFLAFAAGVEV